MGTVQFSHTVPQIDAAVDSINGIAQRLGVDAIVPCTPEQYAAIETKSANTLYIVYGNDKFTMYYGFLPLPSGGGGGGAGAGIMMLSPAGAAGAAGEMTIPEVI